MEVLRTIAGHKLLAMRAILTGWAVLLLLSYAVERPFLALGYRWIGGPLWASASVVLDCLALAASGWVVARLHRPWQTAMLLVFLVSLAPFDVASYTGQTMALNLPWLAKVARNAAWDSRYLIGFVSALATNGLLLICLWTGGNAAGPHDDQRIKLQGIT